MAIRSQRLLDQRCVKMMARGDENRSLSASRLPGARRFGPGRAQDGRGVRGRCFKFPAPITSSRLTGRLNGPLIAVGFGLTCA